MLTKLDYEMYNYRKLTTLLTMSLIHYYFFRAPFVSNYNSELLHQTNLKESVITITGFNTVVLMLESTIACLISYVIEKIICGFKSYNDNVFNMDKFRFNLISDVCFDNKLDLSNPFLYSNKTICLRE